MKKNLMSLLTLIGFVTIFAACSSDNDDSNRIKSPIVGTWTLDSVVKGDQMQQSPVQLVWTKKEGVAEEDFTINLGFMPMPIDEKVTTLIEQFAGAMLETVLQSVTFHNDANITAKYNEVTNDSENAKWVDSPKGLVSFSPMNETQIAVKLNIDAIVKEAEIADQSTIKLLNQFLSESIPVHYSINGEKLRCYVDLDFIGPKIDAIISVIKDLPEESLGSFGSIIQIIIPQIPGLLENTDVFEIGLRLKK